MSARRALLTAALLAAGCAPLPAPTLLPPPQQPGYAGYASSKYGDPHLWLCRPDLPADRCRVDLTATEIHPDGSRTVVPHVPAAAPKVDCFYVYPTVDLSLVPRNHDDFSNLDPMSRPTTAQAARLAEVCNLYVPLYRQVTIGTYLFGARPREARLAVAFSDVADAFAHYLGQYNQGRKIVLVGHSQGAEMVVRLLRRFFEQDPALKERLLLAMAIGGAVDVPPGRLSGGTLPTIPLCSRPDELGCVVAYQTRRAGNDASPGGLGPHPGNETACVNPAGVDRTERRPFSRAYLPVSVLLTGARGVTTPFVVYRDFYAGQCVSGPGGYRYLAVSEARGAGDTRESPFDLGQVGLNTGLGTHILDMQFPQGDLIDMVARRVAGLGR